MIQDWIVAPQSYTAFRCEGVCKFPLNNKMNATNHAIMQSLIKLLGNEDADFPNPCCSPKLLDPLTVVYYHDSKTLLYKKYKDMVVRSCGCNWTKANRPERTNAIRLWRHPATSTADDGASGEWSLSSERPLEGIHLRTIDHRIMSRSSVLWCVLKLDSLI